MKEGKIAIHKKGEMVRTSVEGLGLIESINLLMNAMNNIIEENIEEPKERTAIAAFIGVKLAAKFADEEKIHDQV